jgi:hypothetical protein
MKRPAGDFEQQVPAMEWSGWLGRSFFAGASRIKANILCMLASGAVLLGMVFPLGAADRVQHERTKWHGGEAEFRSGLEANGFIVNSGYAYPVDPIADLLDTGLGDSANANNAGQPYKVLMISPHPFTKLCIIVLTRTPPHPSLSPRFGGEG